MKKIICLTLLLILNSSAFAETCVQEQVIREEFLFPEKNCTERKVVITNNRNILCKGNVFKIAFDCKFCSENVKAGDKISFSFLESIYTQEGKAKWVSIAVIFSIGAYVVLGICTGEWWKVWLVFFIIPVVAIVAE